MYKAEILADSINTFGDRITTMKITFPRIMLAEFNTHRMFSRNSASSRAIPFKRMVQMVEENPFIPIAWQKDHKGMQGTEYITDSNLIEQFNLNWLSARNEAIRHAQLLAPYNNEGITKMGVTKQLCNRLLEPFMWHTVIVTATEWENFFNLRCPQYELPELPNKIFRSSKDAIAAITKEKIAYYEGSYLSDMFWLEHNKSQADIHIQAIAELMWDVMNESTPKQLQAGEWHIPFGDNINRNELLEIYDKKHKLPELRTSTKTNVGLEKLKVKIATARCARISYQTLGDDPKIDYEADIRLHDMLAESGHWSPFEHVAKAMSDWEHYSYVNGKDTEEDVVSYTFNANSLGWCRNFKGFIQYRHLMDN